jgi:hypothetical protein
MAETLVGTFTVSLQDNRFLVASHGLINGDTVKFKLDDPATCALPFPLNESDLFHVVGARGNDFQVSDTPGGPIINMLDKGTGSNEVWKQIPGEQSNYMIKYTGEGNFTSINLRLFGDGITKDLSIDLSKPPFNLNFLGFYPKNVGVTNVSPGLAKSVSINGNNLLVVFNEPPPAVVFNPTITDVPENRLSFTIYFVYGTGVS